MCDTGTGALKIHDGVSWGDAGLPPCSVNGLHIEINLAIGVVE